jgi:hypothetical protein
MKAEINRIDRTNRATSIGIIGGVGSLELEQINKSLMLLTTTQGVPILRRISPSDIAVHPSGLFTFIPALLRSRNDMYEASLLTYNRDGIVAPVAVDLAHLLQISSVLFRGREESMAVSIDQYVSQFAAFTTGAAAYSYLRRVLPKGYGFAAWAVWLSLPILEKPFEWMMRQLIYLDKVAIADLNQYVNLLVQGLVSLKDGSVTESQPASIVRDWLTAALTWSIMYAEEDEDDLGDLIPGDILADTMGADVYKTKIVVAVSENRKVTLERRESSEIVMDYLTLGNEISRIPVLFFRLDSDDEKATWESMELANKKIAEKNKERAFYAGLTAARDKAVNVDVLIKLI